MKKKKVKVEKVEVEKELTASQVIPKDDRLSDAEILDMFDGSQIVTKFSDIYMIDPSDPKKWVHEAVVQHKNDNVDDYTSLLE